MCAYADGLYRRMAEIPVLITGETGTRKGLAAECIGGTRELVESALFGHKRGSFTGAAADATGTGRAQAGHGHGESHFLALMGAPGRG